MGAEHSKEDAIRARHWWYVIGSALIEPDNCRSQWASISIDVYDCCSLGCEGNCFDRFGIGPVLPEISTGQPERIPVDFAILLSPTWFFRYVRRKLNTLLCKYFSALVKENCSYALGAVVDCK